MPEQKPMLVVGGGPAGLASALELAESGRRTYLVEKEYSLGGRWLNYGCKASKECSRCNVCLVFPIIDHIRTHPSVELITGTTVKRVEGTAGDFRVTIQQQGFSVKPDLCTACGLCEQGCSGGVNVVVPPHPRAVPQAYRIDPRGCRRVNGEDCRACQDACPTGAIDLDALGRETVLDVDTVIIAAGFEPFDIQDLPEYIPAEDGLVISALELEKELQTGVSVKGGRTAFIQCAGSRSRLGKRDYCSRVCCGYALRMSRALKRRDPEHMSKIFYMDLQLVDAGLREIYRACKEEDGTEFVRGLPSGIRINDQGQVELRFEDLQTGCLRRECFDRVVLATGIGPASTLLADTVGFELNGNGFVLTIDGEDGVHSTVDGILVAGTCQGPRDISYSISHGRQAALEALRRRKVGQNG